MTNLNASNDFQFLMNTVRPDGMVNATALTTAYRNTTGVRKDAANWLITQEAQDSIAYLERATGIPVASLVIAENGIGTWLHPDLAEILAMWISVEYRFAVVALIRQTKAAVTVPVSNLPKLPFANELLEEVKCISAIQNSLDNPRLVQFYIDQIVDARASSSANQKAFAEIPIRGAAEIAENLGLPVNQKNRSQLGKFMAKQGHEILREARLCNGQMRYINCYYQTAEVEASIRSFFN